MAETEADTRANRIDPVLRDAGWGVVDGSRAAREEMAKVRITTVRAHQSVESGLLLSLNGRKLVVIEA